LQQQSIRTILDFGCGFGADVKHYNDLDYQAYGYDSDESLNFPSGGNLCHDLSLLPMRKYDLVTCVYVLNILCEEPERRKVCREVMEFCRAGGTAVFVARSSVRAKKNQPCGDGYVTEKGFQRAMDKREIEGYMPQNCRVFKGPQLKVSDASIVFVQKV
jgi:hypothetical protein